MGYGQRWLQEFPAKESLSDMPHNTSFVRIGYAGRTTLRYASKDSCVVTVPSVR